MRTYNKATSPLHRLMGAKPPAEIVILGFPKCGSTALIDTLEAADDVTVIKGPGGSKEVPWPAIRNARDRYRDDQIVAHKFVGYIFNATALTHLAQSNPRSLAVLCVRDPKKALLSWRKMHQSIAQRGTNKSHMAWRNRAFFKDAPLADYYAEFARRKLRYDKHFEGLRQIFPDTRIVLVRQERMAADIGSVADYLRALARGDTDLPPPAVPTGAQAHKGFADRTEQALPVKIANELDRVSQRLDATLADSQVRVLR